MKKNTSISVVIITLNEEKNIERCLISVQKIADEILIIDSGSDDRTKEICSNFSTNFIEIEWQGYAATKNHGNSLAKSDYILSLDADEELSEELQNEILKLKSEGLEGSYELDRHNFYLGKWIKKASWHPDYKVRLFEKGKAKWEGDFVHETLNIGEEKLNRINGALNHYSIQSVEQHKQTVRKYAELAAQREKKLGKKRNLLKAIASSAFTYFKILILKGGILEGSRGFKIARYSAWSKWLRYQFLKKMA